jgi:hypothetical protein
MPGGEKYIISERSGRLKKRVRIKKKSKKKKIWPTVLKILTNPILLLGVIAVFAFFIWREMGQTGKKSGYRPLKNAEEINNKVYQKKGQ